MFSRLLIANRGEIACRVIRTARRMGLATIAVYSDADADAAHVALADEAYAIGPAPARESYLDVARILAAANRAGAEAVHPGYGFLSENADFAAACAAAGLVFVGPPPAAMRALGDKAHAKALAAAAGIPVVPGYAEEGDAAQFAAAAARIGFPLLVKAAAGGGGRGMRIVERADDLAAALASAGREAEAAFGDGRLLLEKYLPRARHIEVQVFADAHGEALSLFERDCSVQRRHQKIIEEAPAPGLSREARRQLGGYAVALARSAGYVGAGTVEFIAGDGGFFFIEMNTRLQVEHPVTEAVTGLDLVEWQLRVAMGERLPLAEDAVAVRGHAIEARLYAEDAGRDFLPQAGRIARLVLPKDVRVECGLTEGETVGVHYDPMLAKLIAWGEDRATAIGRLARALRATRVLGVTTNRDFLLRVLADPEFGAGGIDTAFLGRSGARLVAREPPSFAALAAAGLAAFEASPPAARAGDPHSPWARRDGFRLMGVEPARVTLIEGETAHDVRLAPRARGLWVEAAGTKAELRHSRTVAGDLVLEWEAGRVVATVTTRPGEVSVALDEETRRFSVRDPWAPAAELAAAGPRLAAPMPGKILAVHVARGESVKRGQLLMVLEAMKMEHAVTAPSDGVVDEVHYRVGDLVEEGALLVAFTDAARSS